MAPRSTGRLVGEVASIPSLLTIQGHRLGLSAMGKVMFGSPQPCHFIMCTASGRLREIAFPDAGTYIGFNERAIERRAEHTQPLELRARVLAVSLGAGVEADLGD